MAVGDAYVFPGFLTPVLTQLFFPKLPTTFLTLAYLSHDLVDTDLILSLSEMGDNIIWCVSSDNRLSSVGP